MKSAERFAILNGAGLGLLKLFPSRFLTIFTSILALAALSACGSKEKPAPQNPPRTGLTKDIRGTGSSPSQFPTPIAKQDRIPPLAPTPLPVPASGEIRLTPEDRQPELEIADVRHSPTAIDFTLKLPAGKPIPKDPEPLIFCVPSEGKLQIKTIRYRLGDRALYDDGSTTASQKSFADTLPKSLDIKRLGILRHWPMGALAIKPAFFDPLKSDAGHGALEVSLRIAWEQPVAPIAKFRFASELGVGAPWEWVGKKLIVNPDALNDFEVADPPLRKGIGMEPTTSSALVPGTRPWARLRVAQPGFYRLDLARLAEIGLPEAQSTPDQVRLFHHGKPHPLLKRGQGEETAIYFWSEPNDSIYSKEQIYWVTLGGDLPDAKIEKPDPLLTLLPARPVSKTFRTASVNRDNELLISYGDFRAVRSMRWADTQLKPGAAVPITVRFDDPPTAPALLNATFSFYFLLDNFGHSPVLARGMGLKVATGDGKTTSTAFTTDQDNKRTFQFPASLIHDGMTTFALTLEQAQASPFIEAVWLDSLSVRYPAPPRLRSGRMTLYPNNDPTRWRLNWTPLAEGDSSSAGRLIALAVTSLGQAEREVAISKRVGVPGVAWSNNPELRVEVYDPSAIPLAGSFEIPASDDLANENQGADYLIITHHDFLQGVEPLAELHRRQGLRVRVVDVQTVYDTFSHGELTPHALRNFLAYTLEHWREGAPSYVLLVGDCDSDYRDYARKNVRNWVPTYAHESGSDQWASDEWMALVAGEDLLSDFMLTRISVNNVKDLEAVVKKQIRYATDYPFGPWRARTAMIADNEPEFPLTLDRLRDRHLPRAYESDRVFLSELPCEDNYYAEDDRRRQIFATEGRWMKISGVATRGILDLFRSGEAVMTYFGHGSPNVWADERLWFGGDSPNSDNLYLTGTGYTPFVANFTCNTGAIDYPIPQWNIDIVEDMARVENGGAIGAWVPSGPGLSPVQEALGSVLFKALFQDRARRIGEINNLTKARYAATDRSADYIYMYVTLGDPAQELHLTPNVSTFALPDAAASPGGTIRATLADVVPASGLVVAQIDNERGETLWKGENTTYTQGRLPMEVKLAGNIAAGPKVLRVYAWNSDERKDFAASARFEVALPEDDLTTASIRATGLSRVHIRAEIQNKGRVQSQGGRIEIAKLSGERSFPVAGEPYTLKAGEAKRLDFDVLNSSDPTTATTTSVFEVRLKPSHLSSKLIQAAEPAMRLALNKAVAPSWHGPHLRIRPSSLATDPLSPSEGETIFVSCVVENQGDRPSNPASLILFDNDPAKGGKPAYDHNTTPLRLPNRLQIEPLGASREFSAKLRWDPSFNAGDQTYWVQLEPNPLDPKTQREDLLTSGSLRARTKAKLGYRGVHATANREDAAKMRMFLHAEIVNEGETEARNVSIAFFKGKKTSPENLIWETVVEKVPPQSAVPVQYEWNFKERSALFDAEGNTGFRIQVWIKGTKQRITSPLPETQR